MSNILGVWFSETQTIKSLLLLWKRQSYNDYIMLSHVHIVSYSQYHNSHLVCDPTIRQPGFDLPLQQWSLLNRFRTEQGYCAACRRKWRLTDTDLCPCGETQTMSHIVKSCPLTKLNGGLSRLHSAHCYLADQLWFMTCTREKEDSQYQLSLTV